jgi:hypothetical protein
MKPLGSWEKCKVKDQDVLALEKEGIVAPKLESQWWTHYKALALAPNMTEILMLKSHVERGLSMLPLTSSLTSSSSMAFDFTIFHQIA